MAFRATSGVPETRKGVVPARTVAAALLSCLLAFSVFFWAHGTVAAQAITINGMHPPYPGYTSQIEPMNGVETSADWARVASSQAASGGVNAQLHRVEDVRARSYLRVTVRVRDKDGLPVRNQLVSIWWTYPGSKTLERAFTDEHGDASVLHWLPANARGHKVVVSAWAATPEWSNGTYAWFVAR